MYRPGEGCVVHGKQPGHTDAHYAHSWLLECLGGELEHGGSLGGRLIEVLALGDTRLQVQPVVHRGVDSTQRSNAGDGLDDSVLVRERHT